MIEAYFKNEEPVLEVAKQLKRSRQTIYTVYHFLKQGTTVYEYYRQYKENKTHCGRRSIVLPPDQREYVQNRVAQGWTLDVIVGRAAFPISCSARTLYRQFKKNQFDVKQLPMKGKRKPKGHKERRGKQTFKRTLLERASDYPNFQQEFGHLEGDTIVDVHHKSAIITLVERLSKVIITLKPEGRRATAIEKAMTEWLQKMPKNLFKFITFECGKEFSMWKSVSNTSDIALYFADPWTPSQRALNEHSNGLLRKDGLPKTMDFNQVDQAFVSAVASKRNHIPRKSLNYKTPLEVFMKYMDDDTLSSII
ncbi:IS30 family transposase [Enterococcus rivorum]|uniref:IS30 family transposase n=1 Tax=Enterococcus rivorum TaxID=762845 RepID=UPI003609B05D